MPPLLLPLGKCALPQTGNPSCCVLDSRTKLCRFSVAQKQTRVVPWRGTPVGLGCPDHAAWARCCSCSCPQACREVRAQRQASRSRRELFPARRTSPGKRGHSGGSGSGAGPGALSTPLPAPSHRAPFFWEGSRLKSHHFTKWLLFLLKPNHPTCQTGVTKRLQKNQNNPKTLLQWMNPPFPRNTDPGTALVSHRAFLMLAGCSLFTPKPTTASPGCLRAVRSSALYGPRPRSSTGWYDHTGLHLVFISVLPVCNYHLPRCVCRC